MFKMASNSNDLQRPSEVNSIQMSRLLNNYIILKGHIIRSNVKIDQGAARGHFSVLKVKVMK